MDSLLLLILAIPMLGCILMGLIGHREAAPEVNAGLSLGTFIAVAILSFRIITAGSGFALGELFYVDSLNIFLVSLTAFVGFTTSLFSRSYMRVERNIGRMTPIRTRIYHSMYQLFMLTMLLALLTNNIGILWVSMEIATLAAVLLVSIYRTAAALEAAWK